MTSCEGQRLRACCASCARSLAELDHHEKHCLAGSSEDNKEHKSPKKRRFFDTYRTVPCWRQIMPRNSVHQLTSSWWLV